MTVTGIIAEYNPFHNGHAYHIAETRRKTGADYIIAVISGDFVQRGAPALLDKYTRADMALQCGADLVLELPAAGAVSSAETFAASGIRLLDSLGIADSVSFGCEAGSSREQELLILCARHLYKESDTFRLTLAALLKQGMTFPRARAEALRADFAASADVSCPEPKISALLKSPNNILAVEYLKALLRGSDGSFPMKPCMIPRKGSGYHSTSISGCTASAAAIRQLLSESADSAALFPLMPPAAEKLLRQAVSGHRTVTAKDFSHLLQYALLTQQMDLPRRFSQEPRLAERLCQLMETYTDWPSFALAVKTKERTLTAVNRYLVQILLGIDAELIELFQEQNFAPYARILGFRRAAAPLLASLKKQSSIPVITSVSDGLKHLSPPAARLLQNDLTASAVYNSVLTRKTGSPCRNDFRRPLIYR
jgi:predicted nucleotidyltransferase